MILLHSEGYKQSPIELKEIFKDRLLLEVKVLENSGNLGIRQLLKVYESDEIIDAIKNIDVDLSGYIIIPEDTKYCKILKYLEYGGEGIRPTHAISNTIKVMHTMKGENNVFKF